MAQLGFRTLNEMIGHSERIEMCKAIEHYKAKGLDFTKIFYQPPVADTVGRYCQITQDHGLEKSLDNTTLMEICKPALERGEQVRAALPIRNVHRVVGTIVVSEWTPRHASAGLAD